MKKALLGLLIFTVILSFCSCTRVIYTQEVLQNCHTGTDVMKQFGKPDKRTTVDSNEVWIYYKLVTPTNNISKTTPRAAVNNPIKVDSLNAATNSTKYIKFIIDTNNQVVGYKNNGLDLTRKVKVSAGSATMKILGSEIVVSILLAVALSFVTKN